MIAVQRCVSDGIFRHQLEGFDRYPKGRDERFLEVFNEQAVSVDHARAVAQSFKEKMPTLQEVIDTCLNLRPRFEVVISEKEQWERQYGPPKPFSADFTERPGREIDRLWQEVMAFLRSTKFDGHGDIQRVHIGRCWQVAQHLGYEMNAKQQAEIAAYEHTYPASRERLPAKKTPITQADIDRLKHSDVKALAGNDDAGRWE